LLVKPGDLVHFIDCKDTQYDTLGLIVGFMPKRTRGGFGGYDLFKVEWYDDPSCGVEDYNEEDLELVSEGWRFS
jgi:hypothetical protein